MPKQKLTLTFQLVSTPIVEAVTKFGGQPVWVGTPQWPLSRASGSPMQFICQIRLSPELFGLREAQMAYVFMTENDEAVTWEPDFGENAVILQPGLWAGPSLPLREGPSLHKLFYPDVFESLEAQFISAASWNPDDPQSLPLFDRTLDRPIKLPCEYAVELHPGVDSEEQISSWTDGDNSSFEAYWEAYQETKIGGIPVPGPNDNELPYPSGGPWHLLLQLPDMGGLRAPFEINFANGNGYAYLSADGSVGKFLWTR